jgi:hypothetical protein
MSIAAELQANVRSTAAQAYSSGVFNLDQNHRGDLCVAQALPALTELARLGATYYVAIPTGNAYTPVAAMPTTRSELTLRNGYSDTTCLVIDSIVQMSLTSIAAVTGCTVLYQVNEAAALTDNTAVLFSSNSGRTYSGSATRALATTTAVANKWMGGVSGAGLCGSTVTIGASATLDLKGSVIVKPGFTLHTNAVWSTAAGTAITFVLFHEVKLPTVA